jgi:predicted RNase H-like HicB family nuclease
MNIKAIIHEAEEGGFWAQVPAIPGCATQGGTMEELAANLREAIEGCLSAGISPPAARRAGAGHRRLKSVAGRAFVRRIERRGWVLLRVNGSLTAKRAASCGFPCRFTAMRR